MKSPKCDVDGCLNRSVIKAMPALTEYQSDVYYACFDHKERVIKHVIRLTKYYTDRTTRVEHHERRMINDMAEWDNYNQMPSLYEEDDA